MRIWLVFQVSNLENYIQNQQLSQKVNGYSVCIVDLKQVIFMLEWMCPLKLTPTSTNAAQEPHFQIFTAQ